MRRHACRSSRRRFLRGSLALGSIGLLGGCGIALPQPRQPARVHRIGYLRTGAGALVNPDRAEALQQGLRELGYREGEHYVLERRSGEGEVSRLPGLAAELIALPVDVLLTSGSGTTEAARDATGTTPIVMVYPFDPVGGGLVASLSKPGGNDTGVIEFNTELRPKRLELLKEALPGISRVALIQSVPPPDTISLRDAARTLGVGLHELTVREPGDLEAAFEDATRASADAIYWGGGGGGRSPAYGSRVLALAAANRLPVTCGFLEWVEAGALMAYATNYPALFRHAAIYIDKILKGAKPADLPVEQPTTFDFAINLKTAQALGLTIPQSVLQQATEVIQ